MNRFGIYFAEMKKKRDREKKQFAISSLEINRKIHFEMKHDVAEKFVERCFSFGKRVWYRASKVLLIVTKQAEAINWKT